MKALTSLFFALYLVGCTWSFHNITTHGTATDLVDDNFQQDANADVDVPVCLEPGPQRI